MRPSAWMHHSGVAVDTLSRRWQAWGRPAPISLVALRGRPMASRRAIAIRRPVGVPGQVSLRGLGNA
jgi:hypothetical protein